MEMVRKAERNLLSGGHGMWECVGCGATGDFLWEDATGARRLRHPDDKEDCRYGTNAVPMGSRIWAPKALAMGVLGVEPEREDTF